MEAFLKPFSAPAPLRVWVNLNAITAEGFIRVRQSQFDGPVEQGALVQVYESDEEIEGYARIARVNERTGLVYLDIAWDSLRDLEPVTMTQTFYVSAGPSTAPTKALDRMQLAPGWA